jgi:hypothetical protein
MAPAHISTACHIAIEPIDRKWPKRAIEFSPEEEKHLLSLLKCREVGGDHLTHPPPHPALDLDVTTTDRL